MLLFVIN